MTTAKKIKTRQSLSYSVFFMSACVRACVYLTLAEVLDELVDLGDAALG